MHNLFLLKKELFMLDTKKYLGARIQEIRKQKNLKQAELAELIDIDSKHMSKIECGRCYPSFELLDRIALKLNVPISNFLETEHLQTKEKLLEEIVCKLKNADENKFRTAYKILKEIL